MIDPESIKWDYFHQKFSYISNTFNSADLQALQWACDYKEKKGATITVIIAADTNVNIESNRLLKYRLDKCIVIQQPNLKKWRNETANILANEIKKHSFDVILSGSVSEDENLGVTPTMVAELLHIPFLTHIQEIDIKNERVWKVKRSEGRGIVQTYEVQLPLLIGVVNSLGRKRYIPRYLRSSKTQGEFEIHKLKEPIGKSNVKILKVSEPKPNIRYFDIPDDSLSTEQRLLKIMGLSKEENEQSGEKVTPEVNERNIHFLSQKIQKWLKEG